MNNSPASRRWNKICSRAYAEDTASEILAEYYRRMDEIGDLYCNLGGSTSVTDEQYNLCADILLAIIEPKVSLSVQADEYEECMRAEEIMDGLST